ncbi:hypothetical protein [Streptomyces sp. NPDC006552]|uniref:hypothetical protein n=1 Tax=Streptomyces sp. NPDC006552 TaxID=3157179 RepID=UPI0033A4D978
MAFTLTAGNVNDCTQFEAVMARISIARCGLGQPRTRPGGRGQGLLVREDPRLPAQTRHQSGQPRTDRSDHRPYPARRATCHLDRAAYRRRNVVERCFNKLKHHKALATRYDRRARHYQAMVTLACLQLGLP